MSLLRTTGIVCSPITVVVRVKGGPVGQFAQRSYPHNCDLLDEEPVSQRRSGTRPWPMLQGKVSLVASASLFSHRIPVCELSAGRLANTCCNFPSSSAYADEIASSPRGFARSGVATAAAIA